MLQFTIIDLINELRNNSSTNKKIKILESYIENTLWKKIIYYCYNSNFNYYIKKYNVSYSDDITLTIDDMFDVLDTLIMGEIRGNEAIKTVEETISNLGEDLGYIMSLILNRDLKVGCNIKTFNKVYDDLIPTTPYMGCQESNVKKIKNIIKRDGGIYVEKKEDGQYANILLKEKNIEIVSRQGKPTNIKSDAFFNSLDEIRKSEKPNKMQSIVLNGELLIRGYGRGVANGIITRISNINNKTEEFGENSKQVKKETDKFFKEFNKPYYEVEKDIYFVCWDFIPIDSYYKGVYLVTRENRLNFLLSIINRLSDDSKMYIQPPEVNYVKSMTEVFKILKDRLSQGEEGVVCKSITAIWQDGKKTEQFKMKIEFNVEMKIIGYKMGSKGTKYCDTLGSLHIQSECGKMSCYASGIKEKIKDDGDITRDEFWNNQHKYLNKVVTIKCNGLSINKEGEYNFYYPNYVCLREDKEEANTLSEIIEIQDSILELKDEL